jgi:hypothetical protein
MTEERQENLFEFLSALCGIVGGFITVMRWVVPSSISVAFLFLYSEVVVFFSIDCAYCSILDKCIYSSSKALLGKKD